MIEFTITFLLAFSVKTKERPKEKKSKAKEPKIAQQQISDPPYVLRLEKTCSSAHIEYQLLPARCKPYQIDVLCWQNAAKIYTSDGITAFKTVARNGWTFVPVCIKHILRELSIDELMEIRNAVIEFQVYTEKSKLGAAARANKTDVIYIRETDLDQQGFINAYLDKYNSSFTSKKSPSKRSLQDEDAAHKNEVTSKMVFHPNFAENLYDLIDYTCDESIPRDRIIFRDFVKTCDPTSEAKDEAKKTSAKAKKPADKKKKPAKLTLQLQGEIFFTDADPVFKLEVPGELRKLFVIPHVDNLLTRLQKFHLNPLIIKVGAIKNFPEDYLKEQGVTEIFCKYSIPSIADCRTKEKPLSSSIYFMESHIFPTQNLPKIKLLEFLETRRLVVEVYGVQRYQNVIPQPKLFGETFDDLNIWKLNHQHQHGKSCLEEEDSVKTRNVFLAYCSYDLSSLLKNVWDFRGKEQLHSGESRIVNVGLQALTENDALSLNQINLAGLVTNLPTKSLLKEWVLLEGNSVLDLEAYLLAPQSAALVLHQVPNTFKRLLLIVTNKELARDWFRNILIHNQNVECGGLKPEDILTGFVIDNGNTFVVYVEGPAVGLILNLWQDMDMLTPDDGKVFFNTDQTYETRLYNIDTQWTGFYVVNMKIPLECIFKNQKIYVKGNSPLPCQKALIKLNLMFLTDTMKIMLQQDLFPTIEELVSLDLEYGVPYAWKQLQSSNTSETTEEILQPNEDNVI